MYIINVMKKYDIITYRLDKLVDAFLLLEIKLVYNIVID
jgi:hypothetical protein